MSIRIGKLPPLLQNVDLQVYSVKLAKYAHWLISSNTNGINGYLAYYLNNELCQLYIPVIAVFTKEQRKGIGSKLISEAAIVAQSRNFKTIALEVNKTNEQAFKFYIKNQFWITEDRGQKLLMVREI